MPRLSEPSFELKFGLKETVKLIESLLKEKSWHDFEVAEISLEFHPFILFDFEAFSDKEGIVSDIVSGTKVLNAVTGELSEKLSSIITSSLTNEIPEEIKDFKVVTPTLHARDSLQKIQLRLASKLSKPIQNISVTNIKPVYFPFWKIFVTVAEGNYELIVNGVTGEITNEEKIPVREKGFIEITEETFKELQNPANWSRYAQDLISPTFAPKPESKPQARAVAKSDPQASFPKILPFVKNDPYVVLVILLFIVLAIMWFNFLFT